MKSTPKSAPVMLSHAAMLLVAAAAHAQSLNVDFNRAAGPGAGAPSTSYGGAALQTGHWNAVTPSSAGATVGLSNLNGVPLNASLFHDASNGSDNADYGVNDFERLMGDYAFGLTASGNIQTAFSELQPGIYSVYIYAGLPPTEAYYDVFGTPTPHRATVIARRNNEAGQSTVLQGATTNGTLSPGVNYTRFTVPVLTGDTLRVIALADLANPSARVALNGVQLTKWAAPIIHVRPGGAGDRSGRSWTNAMDNLQAAIDLAASMPAELHTQVWVAAGVYKPTTSTDRTTSFRIPGGVSLYGGFQGTETSLAQRSITTHVTQLSGEIGASTIADNSYHVLRAEHFTEPSLIDGFNIARGNANGLNDHARGGAALIRSANLQFRNCLIIGNRATSGGALYMHGVGEVLCYVRLVKCQVSQNSAVALGGAIFLDADDADGTWIAMSTCTIDRNTTLADGGFLASNGGTAFIGNSLILGNAAARGGFVHVNSDSNARFSVYRSTVVHNRATNGAAGIEFNSPLHLTIGHSIFWHNARNDTTDRQAQVLIHNGTSSVDYSNFQGNTLGWYTNGAANMSRAPMFLDADGPNNVPGDLDDNLRLAATSPCIDAGSSWIVALDDYDIDEDGNTVELLPLDLDLMPRYVDVPFVADTGSGDAPLTDMGCYEATYQTPPPPPCAADFNADGVLNSQDFFDFLTALFATTPNADFNHDAAVNSQDFFDFLVAFFAGEC